MLYLLTNNFILKGALITYMNLSDRSKELYNSYYYSSLKSLNYGIILSVFLVNSHLIFTNLRR